VKPSAEVEGGLKGG